MQLVPPRLIHARLDLGWCADDRLGMWAIECRNPVTSDLIAASVQPLRTFEGVVPFLLQATARQREQLLELLDPAPF